VTRTFWISFADEEGFLGVCVIDVTEADVAWAVAQKPLPPTARPGAEWLAAAIQLAWTYGCNPGGGCGLQEIPTASPLPRNRLLTDAELQLFGSDGEPPVVH
jgi:hypothetical protein